MALALAVGLAPALPVLLVVVAVVGTYLMASTLASIITMGRVIRGNSTAAACLDDLFVWIINAPISLLTLTQLKPPVRRAKPVSRAAPAISPLPAAPVAARNEDEPVYWNTLQRKLSEPGGARDDVKLPGDRVTQPMQQARGRHARQDTAEVGASVLDAPLPEMSGQV
jgi:hypothetical protein